MGGTLDGEIREVPQNVTYVETMARTEFRVERAYSPDAFVKYHRYKRERLHLGSGIYVDAMCFEDMHPLDALRRLASIIDGSFERQ